MNIGNEEATVSQGLSAELLASMGVECLEDAAKLTGEEILSMVDQILILRGMTRYVLSRQLGRLDYVFEHPSKIWPSTERSRGPYSNAAVLLRGWFARQLCAIYHEEYAEEVLLKHRIGHYLDQKGLVVLEDLLCFSEPELTVLMRDFISLNTIQVKELASSTGCPNAFFYAVFAENQDPFSPTTERWKTYGQQYIAWFVETLSQFFGENDTSKKQAITTQVQAKIVVQASRA